MIKFSHSVFALPFALIALFLAADGMPRVGQLLLVVVCMVSARSAAMTFNRLADREIDARNPRTANRALPRVLITRGAAIGFLLLAVSTFAMACISFYAFFGNPWPMRLGAPVLLYLCGYSYAKRFTKWSHFYLGSAIALSPVAAWLAINPNSLGWPAFVLMAAVTCWVAGFDIIYACQDIEVDRRDGLHSLPSRWGPSAALAVTRICHVLTVGLLFFLGYLVGLGRIYLAGVVVMAILLIVENCMVRPGDYSRVNLAFFTANGIVGIAFGALAITDIVLDIPPVW